MRAHTFSLAHTLLHTLAHTHTHTQFTVGVVLALLALQPLARAVCIVRFMYNMYIYHDVI